MRVFLCDAKRALLSWRMLAGFAAMLTVLFFGGVTSALFRLSVPVLCTLPYATAWLCEYRHRFVLYALYRAGCRRYIRAKYICCILSGGLSEALAAAVYGFAQNGRMTLRLMTDGALSCHMGLLLLSGALWAGVSAVLAAVTNSRCMAHGGAFVLYCFLMILQQRYFPRLYFLDPCRWYAPNAGVACFAVLQCTLLVALWFAYDVTLRKKLRYV